MIRRKQVIEAIVENTKRKLSQTIDFGLSFETENELRIDQLKGKLKELSSETSYEETYQGKIEEIEITAFKAITSLLKKLSEITGNEYSFGRRDL